MLNTIQYMKLSDRLFDDYGIEEQHHCHRQIELPTRLGGRGDSWLELDAGTDVFFMPQRGFVNSAECMDKRD
jgi:hypothetical protein